MTNPSVDTQTTATLFLSFAEEIGSRAIKTCAFCCSPYCQSSIQMAVTTEAAAPVTVDGGDLNDWEMFEQPASDESQPIVAMTGRDRQIARDNVFLCAWATEIPYVTTTTGALIGINQAYRHY